MSGDRDRTGSNDPELAAMLARTWVIAANFRTPADYDIPAAPTFEAERGDDGELILFGSEGRVLTAEDSQRVRP